jgi:soluble lytic murein transglycosylase
MGVAICSMATIAAGDAVASSRHREPVSANPTARHQAAAPSHDKHSKTDRAKRAATAAASPPAPAAPELPGELGVLQRAIRLSHQGKLSEARTVAQTLGDPVAQKLAEWVMLRNGDSVAGFDSYAAFIRANPGWPGALLRRRAEARLWQERRDGATVRGFLAGQPASAPGRLALARALMRENDRAAAEREVRAAWRSDELSAELETATLDAFGDMLTRADHAARMDKRIGRKDFGAATRAAHRLGEASVAIVKACAAVEHNAGNAAKLLDAVPADARDDLGYTLCRIQSLLRRDKDGVPAATRLMLAASPEALLVQDTDEWWRVRRTLARKLLDGGDAKTAYEVASGAVPPGNPYYRAEAHFMAGWIALRFLGDATTALAHFSAIDEDSSDPIVLARAAYWRGRAHEAAGHVAAMRTHYEAAARYSTAYYGQLARARLGLGEMELRPAPEPAHGADAEVLHAAELLYAIGERELALSFVTDLAGSSGDAVTLAALADLAVRNDDARAALLIGKSALARGLPLDVSAFPDIGVPQYSPIGPALDRSIVYSVVRTESEFNQRDVSPAKAVGLMQVTPEAGRDTAKRFGVGYDWKRLVTDAVYNTQMGAAELAALLREYGDCYLMSFAGYNAGRGRVQQWVAQYGDPRDPKVDPVDWVERIPFAETRNYVQRVMENLQVYRLRFRAITARTSRADGPPTADDARTSVPPPKTVSDAR